MKKNNIIKRAIVLLLAAAMVSTSIPAFGADDQVKVSLGQDLNESQREVVLQLLGLTEDELKDMDVLYVTNQEEHEYLGSYIDAAQIGDTALSSSKIVLKDKGNGITVTTYNINYCTVGMYQNALATAGVKDADVTVAAPDKISGTAALIGVMKAYSKAKGEDLNTNQVQAATQELAVSSDIAEQIGDPEKAEQLISILKEQLKKIGEMSDEEIDALIRETAQSLEIELSDENVAAIRNLLKNLAAMDLDWDSILGQVKGLYDKLTKANDGSNIIMDFFSNVGNFFSQIFTKIGDFFSNIFK